jgi:hypothetical protein
MGRPDIARHWRYLAYVSLYNARHEWAGRCAICHANRHANRQGSLLNARRRYSGLGIDVSSLLITLTVNSNNARVDRGAPSIRSIKPVVNGADNDEEDEGDYEKDNFESILTTMRQE